MSSGDNENAPELDQTAPPVKPAATLGALFSRQDSGSASKSTPWHLRGASLNHEKRIGMAPRGTRRSMGKR